MEIGCYFFFSFYVNSLFFPTTNAVCVIHLALCTSSICSHSYVVYGWPGTVHADTQIITFVFGIFFMN